MSGYVVGGAVLFSGVLCGAGHMASQSTYGQTTSSRVNAIRCEEDALRVVREVAGEAGEAGEVAVDDLLTRLVSAFKTEPIHEGAVQRLYHLLSNCTDDKGEYAYAITLLYSACVCVIREGY